jgi:hypothetical protein
MYKSIDECIIGCVFLQTLALCNSECAEHGVTYTCVRTRWGQPTHAQPTKHHLLIVGGSWLDPVLAQPAPSRGAGFFSSR